MLFTILSSIWLLLIHFCSASPLKIAPPLLQAALSSFHHVERTTGRPRTSWHVRRQSTLHRVLIANIYYFCPEGGHDSREFEWEAVYRRRDARIIIVGWHNIDKIEPVNVDGHGFSSYLSHGYCTHHDLQMCYYQIRFYVEGAVTEDGVAMSLVTDSNHLEQRPSVKEFCARLVQPPPSNDTCGKGVIIAGYGPCQITHIDVDVVP